MIGFFTVITKNYLAFAHVLMSRIAELHPDSARYIFMIDVETGEDLVSENLAHCLGTNDFFLKGLEQQLHFKYNAFELSNAARPHAHRYLYEQTDCDRWIYLDSDIFPTAAMDALFDPSGKAQILLSPHRITPSGDILQPYGELRLLQNGPFNSGFLGIKRGKHSERFIDWFEDCCNQRCYDRVDYCFVDQLWLGLVPTLFDSVRIVKHPGINIGYWNIDERPMEYDSEGVLTVEGSPVLFLHFSGWDLDHPETMSCHFSDETVSKPWFDYAAEYSKALKKAQEVYPRNIPYRWNTYEDGTPISSKERRKFAGMVENGEWPEELSPFAAQDILREKELDRTERIFGRIRKIPRKFFNLFR